MSLNIDALGGQTLGVGGRGGGGVGGGGGKLPGNAPFSVHTRGYWPTGPDDSTQTKANQNSRENIEKNKLRNLSAWAEECMLNVLNGVCLYDEEPNAFSVGVNGLNRRASVGFPWSGNHSS